MARMVRTVVGGIMALLAGAATAAAAQPPRSCSGMISGNLISPLPKQPSIAVHVSDASAQNELLAERFRTGMREGGAQVSDTGDITMELATSITGAAAASSGTGSVSPEFGLTGNLLQTGESPVLTMSISLMDNKLAQIDWVGYVNCKIRVADLGTVAQELGHAVGRSVGQTFSPRPL